MPTSQQLNEKKSLFWKNVNISQFYFQAYADKISQDEPIRRHHEKIIQRVAEISSSFHNFLLSKKETNVLIWGFDVSK